LSSKLVAGLDAGELFDAAGYFHTLPGVQNTDGFFAAALERYQS
jgi:16S rRNA C967 or C1407 C5-methylase (RsmB/RsmF family)